MPARTLVTGPLRLLTSAAFAAGAANAYRLPPRTMWGDVYGHVPNHLVTAGMALLVAGSLLVLGRHGTTPRARRAGARAAGAWALVSAVFVLDAIGGGIGDRTGDLTMPRWRSSPSPRSCCSPRQRCWSSRAAAGRRGRSGSPCRRASRESWR